MRRKSRLWVRPTSQRRDADGLYPEQGACAGLSPPGVRQQLPGSGAEPGGLPGWLFSAAGCRGNPPFTSGIAA